MDDGKRTILYLVITIAAFVISVIRKNKKKQENQMQQQKTNSNGEQDVAYEPSVKSEVSNNSRLSNSLFAEFFQEPEYYEVNKIEKEKEVKIQESKNTEEKEIDKKPIPDIHDIDREIEDETDFVNEFDLEQAVIYSEILARREY